MKMLEDFVVEEVGVFEKNGSAGLIQITEPNRPKSKNQKYYKL